MTESEPSRLRVEGLAARLRAFDTCLLADAVSATGAAGAVVRLSPVGRPDRVAGPVRTVQLGAARPGVTPERHLGTGVLTAAEPGDVILVSHPSTDAAAGWGGLLSVAAQQAGVAAVVVDGVCRDVDDYLELGFGVWCAGATPRSARGMVVELSTDAPIMVGGARIQPGDWLVADRSGVVIIPADDLERVLVVADRLLATEHAMTAELRAGVPATQVLGRQYEDMVRRSD